MFTFGGAKSARSLQDSVNHVDEKLLRLEGMAKTEVGRELMRERSERMVWFKEWWGEEKAFAGMAGLS